MTGRGWPLVIGLFIGLLVIATVGYGAEMSPKWTSFVFVKHVQPPPGFEEGTIRDQMSGYCRINNNVLEMNTMEYPQAMPGFKLYFKKSPKPGFKLTVVVRAKADAENGMDFDLRYGSRERIRLLNFGIELNTSSKMSNSIKTTEWHTYMIAYELLKESGSFNLVTKVYADGSPTPLLEGKSNTVEKEDQFFKFGDGSSSSGYAGSIAWILWTFDGAFSPNQVQLPTGFSGQ